MSQEYYSILGISPTATQTEIQSAFEEKWVYWKNLQSNPMRAASAAGAAEMLTKLEKAYEFAQMRARTNSAASSAGLEFTETSAVVTVTPKAVSSSETIDKDTCPSCGFREHHTEARFCINCQQQLVQTCPSPSCQTELPWHQEICHRCGTNVNNFAEQQASKQRETELQNQEQQIQALRTEISNLEDDRSFIRRFILPINWNKRARDLKSKYDTGGCLRQGSVFLGMYLIAAAGLWFAFQNNMVTLSPQSTLIAGAPLAVCAIALNRFLAKRSIINMLNAEIEEKIRSLQALS